MAADAQTLLDDYNFYRTKTHNYELLKQKQPGVRLARINPERETLLSALIVWCESYRIDPRHWVYALFCRGRWLYAPQWTYGHLMGEKALEWYQRRGKSLEDRLYQQRLRESREVAELNVNAVRTHNDLVDVSPETESRKKRLAARGDAHGCLTDIRDPDFPTWGYHPKSSVCASCSLADQCKAALRGYYPFDPIALREGHLTLQQANLIAAVNHARS